MTTQLEAAARQALEALESDWDGCVNSTKGEAVTALRSALEQQAAQEPVVRQYGFAAENQRLRLINQSLDEMLDDVMSERDERDDVLASIAHLVGAEFTSAYGFDDLVRDIEDRLTAPQQAAQEETSDCALNLCDPSGPHEAGCHLAKQRVAQEPAFCTYCGGNDEAPQEHCTDCERPIQTKDRIREIFMAHGFTVKEGHTDLKPYVYAAAYALLNEAPQQEAQERQPLTDEELYEIFPAIATYTEANKSLYRSIARAIEAAHGIGDDK